MTTQEIIDYYADLLILQYVGKERAYATIQTQVAPVIMDQLPVAVQNAFAIGTAEGVQLDTIGDYVGVSRSGYGFTGPITLNDDDFTVLIRVAIIRNMSGSSLATIQDLLHTYFPDEIEVFDYANMRLSYYMNSSVGSQNLAQMFVKQGLLPKPMGVQMNALIYAPTINSFFGFRTYRLGPHNVSPFNTYADYHEDYPWLSYADAVVS